MAVKNKDDIHLKENEIEEKILEAAMEVVSTKTISGTRMHLIAESAGIPKSNLHYYFRTKQNLMLALHKKVVSRFIEVRKEIRPTCKDELKAHLDIFIQQKLKCILSEPEFDFVEIDFWLQANIEPEYKRIMREAFATWRQEIEDIMVKYAANMSELEKKHLPSVLISLLEGATIQYHLDSAGFNLSEYMEFCSNMIYKQLNNN
ncbi:MAG: TetR/AcrR family transcriptional regulator [Clostridiales bacterium]|nr:TetR/AcrR family transcriptional regulator [Clostridiales bacterium]